MANLGGYLMPGIQLKEAIMPVTHKELEIVGVNLKAMSHMDLGHFLVNLADSIDLDPKWQVEGCIPKPVPDSAELRDVGQKHLAVTKAADGGDRYKAAERDALRPATELAATIFLQWAQIRSVREDDHTIVTGLGVPPKIQPPKSSSPAVIMTTPQNVQVKQGKTGSALINTGRVPRARIYWVGICEGDPSLEESWRMLGPFDHCRNIEIAGLEPGKMYYFRVKCFGAGSESPWSTIASLRVI
jgi:hypothetical protein